MYETMFDSHKVDMILGRLNKLTPEHQRQWGKLNVHLAVTHMADELRMALGQLAPGVPSGWLRFAMTRYLAIHILPWPKGKTKGPAEAFTTDPKIFADDLALLCTLIKEVAARNPKDQWPQHSMFGKMTGRDWGVLCYRHLDHHLDQFNL
jgi:hypothetical protein